MPSPTSTEPFTTPLEEQSPEWLRQWQQPLPLKKNKPYSLIPLIALLIFIGFVLFSYDYLNRYQQKNEALNTQQGLNSVGQQLRLLFVDNEDDLQNIAISVSSSLNQRESFSTEARKFLDRHPEIVAIYWNQTGTGRVFSESITGYERVPRTIREQTNIVNDSNAISTTIGLGYGKLIFNYTDPFFVAPEISLMYAAAGLPTGAEPEYIITAVYSMDRLLRQLVSSEAFLHSRIWLQNLEGEVIAATHTEAFNFKGEQQSANIYPLSIFDNRLILYAQSIAIRPTITSNILFWFTVLLCVFISALLLLNWRHTSLLVQAQSTAMAESNFRKAVENSVSIGLLAFGPDWKNIYVNPSFCQMVGYKEHELVGTTAPFPYWPPQHQDLLFEIIKQASENLLEEPGYEVLLQRRNGQFFDAKIYISPLMDAGNVQNGWIVSISDISESKRAREELALAGLRFTTILEGMDASISVSAVGSNSLLFTNKAYQELFSDDGKTHIKLADQALNLKHMQQPPKREFTTPDLEAGLPINQPNQESFEVYLNDQERWIEVRSQYLTWVDGSLAQMLIITDITEKNRAKELAAIQAEQVEAANRLITMGEMASSLAHELNQPLTAITNYCSGLIRRIKNQMITEEELIQALQKTAKQADRAGMITLRIRSFVKKKEPRQIMASVTTVFENIYEFVEIEAKRRNVALKVEVEENLPQLYMDPVLIEQTLLNLARNGMEAIDSANRPVEERLLCIEIKSDQANPESPAVEFSITDTGHGIPDDKLKHLFEAFYTTKSSGLGIGLNLCRSIVEAHGGRLYFKNVYSNEQITGCRFAFIIPLNQATRKSENPILT